MPSMASHLRCSVASGFQPSLAHAIKQSLNCVAIKEVYLRRHKANLLAPLCLLRHSLIHPYWPLLALNAPNAPNDSNASNASILAQKKLRPSQ